MAILDIEVLTIDPKKRDEVFQQVIERGGPPDGTVVLTLKDPEAEFTDELVDEILATFGEFGDIILVR